MTTTKQHSPEPWICGPVELPRGLPADWIAVQNDDGAVAYASTTCASRIVADHYLATRCKRLEEALRDAVSALSQMPGYIPAQAAPLATAIARIEARGSALLRSLGEE